MSHSQRLGHLFEEFVEVLLFHASAIISFGVEKPLLFEQVELLLEVLKHILLWKVVIIELLDNDENEEIEHHIRAHNDK